MCSGAPGGGLLRHTQLKPVLLGSWFEAQPLQHAVTLPLVLIRANTISDLQFPHKKKKKMK